MRRRALLGLMAGAAVSPLCAAQTPTIRRILWLSTEAQPDPFIEAFREGMQERGYIEGENIAIIALYRSGDPAALRTPLLEHLAEPIDLIVSSGPAILATRLVTAKPVLFAMSSNPLAAGIADSLARPGRNFTGITFMSLDVAQKRVELLGELVAGLRKLAVLSHTRHFGEQLEFTATREAAQAFSIQLLYAPFDSGGDLDAALQRVQQSQADALLAFPGGATRVYRRKIAEFANSIRLPSFYGSREHCDVGGLASYGANQRATYRRLAAFADRILRGESPAALPIEQPTTFELILNLKTARAVGVEVSGGFLARADEIIE